MKEPNLDLIACDLLDAVCALAGIIDQTVNSHGNITVQYQFASELIRDVQVSASAAARELMTVQSEKGVSDE